MQPNFVLVVNGREIHNEQDQLFSVLDWNVSQAFIKSNSSFRIKMSEVVFKEVTVNDRVTLLLDDTVILKGIIDTVVQTYSPDNDDRMISGRDFNGWMSENDALPKTYSNTTDNAIIEDIFAQAEELGFPFFDNREATFKLGQSFDISEYKVSPGKSFLAICQELAQLNNMYFYIAPDGTFLKSAIAGEEELSGGDPPGSTLTGSGTNYSSKINPTKLNGFLAAPNSTYIVTSPYGANHGSLPSGETFHAGIDVFFNDHKVKSVYNRSGNVTGINYNTDNPYGVYAEVDYNGFVIRYSHMNSVSVKIGDRVPYLSVIGNQGSTGASTGEHCDIRVARNPLEGSIGDIGNEGVSLTNYKVTGTSSRGPGVSEPIQIIDIESGEFSDGHLTIQRDIRNAKSDILVYSVINSDVSDPLEELKTLDEFIGAPQILEDLISTKRKGRASKAIAQVGPEDGQRQDGLNTNNEFRSEGTNVQFSPSRPGSTFRRRKIVSKSGQDALQVFRFIENLLTQTAPSLRITVTFNRLVPFALNSLVHFKFKEYDTDAVVRDIKYSASPSSQRTEVVLLLPNRIS